MKISMSIWKYLWIITYPHGNPEKKNRMDIHQMCVQNPLKIVEIYKVTIETLIMQGYSIRVFYKLKYV